MVSVTAVEGARRRLEGDELAKSATRGIGSQDGKFGFCSKSNREPLKVSEQEDT